MGRATMQCMEAADYLKAISDGGNRMTRVLTGVDLDSAVPSCPEWVVRDLVRHLGGVHAWARTIVGDRLRASPDRELEELVGGWPDDGDLLDWFRAGYEDLVATLDNAPENMQCWTFLDSDSPLLHWARRQAHETSIHRVDAELAAGVSPEIFATPLAADGIDELLTCFITRRGRGPRAATPTSFRLRCTDTGQAWTVYYDDSKVVTERAGDPDVDGVVRASASDLYMWVWHRLARDAVETIGDDRVIDDWNTVQVRWS